MIENLKKILVIFSPYKSILLKLLLCINTTSILTILIPIINQRLIDEGIIVKDIKVVLIYSVYIFIIVLITQLIKIFEAKYRANVENLVKFDLQKKAFMHTLKMQLAYFKNNNSTKMMDNLKSDINNISQICDAGTYYTITSIFRVLIGLVGMVIISWRLALIIVLFSPVRYFIVKNLTGKNERVFKTLLNDYEEYSEWYGDTLAGIKEIKIWGLYESKVNEFRKKQEKIINKEVELSYLLEINNISERVFYQIITLFIYIIGSSILIANELSIGKIFAFITYSNYVLDPIFAIINMRYSFSEIIPSLERYFKFMQTPIENNKDLNKLDTERFFKHIEFKNVVFSYDKQKSILNRINFKVHRGEKIAIIGGNGAGKTTIIELMLRLLEPDSGEILMNDKNVNLFNIDEYRKIFSLVSQELYLFNTTIKENIVLNSNKSSVDLNTLAQECCIEGFINNMPDKYESNVGERGSKLSGGEKQKLAMARALIREHQILILDEATANCDIVSENKINNILSKTNKDRTIIIISHRPDILKKVDRIIVINNGTVEDIGIHEELYTRNKFYQAMLKTSY